MNPSNAQTSMQVYASDNDQYKSSPTEDQIRAGVVPLDTLPAAWWNYYWSMVTSNNNASKLAIDNIRTEIINVLTAAGVTPTADQTNQLLNSILAIHRKAPYFEATGDAVAGSVISSSDIKSISVNSETGKVTVNALADWEGTDTIKESLPTIATAEKAGLVKSSDDMTAVSVDSDGVMTPNALSDWTDTKTVKNLLDQARVELARSLLSGDVSYPNSYSWSRALTDKEEVIIRLRFVGGYTAAVSVRNGYGFIDQFGWLPFASGTISAYLDTANRRICISATSLSYSADVRVYGTGRSLGSSAVTLAHGHLSSGMIINTLADQLPATSHATSATYLRPASSSSTLVTADASGNLKAHTLELT